MEPQYGIFRVRVLALLALHDNKVLRKLCSWHLMQAVMLWHYCQIAF